MTTTIREAVIDDVHTLHDLGKDVSEFSVNESTVTFWPEHVLTSAIAHEDTSVLVAEEGDVVVGFIIAGYSPGLRKATIENIFVSSEHRGKGIGEQLLEKLLASLRGRGCEYVATLVPLDAVEAIELYGKAGFTSGETFVWLDKPLADNFESNGERIYG